MNYVMPSMYLPGDNFYANKGGNPYIGVTGFTSSNHITAAIDAYSNEIERCNAPHGFMAGILLSHKILDGDGTPKYPARYPSLDKIAELLATVKKCRKYGTISAIHYNTKNPYLFDEIEKIDDFIGGKPHFTFDAVQFNVGFIPSEHEISKIRDRHRDRALIIIVQINRGIMEGNDNHSIVDKFSHLNVNHILIDPSGGAGKDIDVTSSASMYKNIRSASKATVGFAGGFSPGNVEEKVRQYARELGTTRFSIDAEGNLRDKTTDVMDIDLVTGYIRGFFRGIADSRATVP